MAVVDASGAGEFISLSPFRLNFGTVVSAAPNVFVYTAPDGATEITLLGNFVYDMNGDPSSGTVTSIAVDLSGNGGTDLLINQFDTPPQFTALLADFIPVAFAEADTFIPAPFTQGYFGDFETVDSGETVVAAGDTFDFPVSTGLFSDFFADGVTVNGTATGGDDIFDFEDGNQTPGTLHFDVRLVQFSGLLNGGNDRMILSSDASINGSTDLTIHGDAELVRFGGSVNGGDDIVNNTSGTRLTVYGDVNELNTSGTLVGGNDTITTIGGSTTVAGFFSDTIYGDARSIDGGAMFTGGNDIISTGSGDDVIYGDYQTLINGTIVAGGNDIIDGGGNDDMIFGNEGNDHLTGGTGADTVDAGAGNDTVVAIQADGDDTYTGGSGFDVLDFSQVQGVVQINQLGGVITGSAGNDVLMDVFEQIIGSNFDDALSGGNGGDVLDGNDGNDQFFANGGDDLVRGGEGNDTFFFSTNDGNDRLEGGAGFDVLDYSTIQGVVQVNQLAGTTTGTANNDILLDVFEQVIGSNFDDVLSGGNGINALNGGGGNDQLFANGGDDQTSGGDGNDTITLGLGDDRHDFRNGEDIDTITDFNAGAGSEDQIILTFHSAATSFAQMQMAGMFTQNGADTQIDLGGGDMIILQNVLVGALHQDDFIF